MMTNAQKADRLALIKDVHEKIEAEKRSNATFKAKLKAKSKIVSASPARKVRKSEVKDLTEAFSSPSIKWMRTTTNGLTHLSTPTNTTAKQCVRQRNMITIGDRLLPRQTSKFPT